MLVRRLLLLLAVLIALTVLAGTLAPVPGPLPQPAVSPAPSPAAGPRREDGGEIRNVHATLSAAPNRPARLITARVGDLVTITVRSDVSDSVALGELDVKPVEPRLPAHFDLVADAVGRYPLVLLDARRRIGTLQVR